MYNSHRIFVYGRKTKHPIYITILYVKKKTLGKHIIHQLYKNNTKNVFLINYLSFKIYFVRIVSKYHV